MSYAKKLDRLERIIDITRRLFAYERFHAVQVAKEYNKSSKTITRDLEKISEIIPLQRKRGVWRIDESYIARENRLPVQMLKSFAGNAGLDIPFVNSDDTIPLISFAIAYDSIPVDIAERIIESIEQGRQCSFDYINNQGIRSRKQVSPAKLYTAKGKWYLIAKDSSLQTIRSYDFYKIKNFKLLNTPIDINTKELKEIQERSSVWSSDTEPFEVILDVAPYAKRYIDEMPLHKTQSMLSLHSDGGAQYHYTITHPMELLPAIKEWIPHIYIVEPDFMRDNLKEDIEYYLKTMS